MVSAAAVAPSASAAAAPAASAAVARWWLWWALQAACQFESLVFDGLDEVRLEKGGRRYRR